MSNCKNGVGEEEASYESWGCVKKVKNELSNWQYSLFHKKPVYKKLDINWPKIYQTRGLSLEWPKNLPNLEIQKNVLEKIKITYFSSWILTKKTRY